MSVGRMPVYIYRKSGTWLSCLYFKNIHNNRHVMISRWSKVKQWQWWQWNSWLQICSISGYQHFFDNNIVRIMRMSTGKIMMTKPGLWLADKRASYQVIMMMLVTMMITIVSAAKWMADQRSSYRANVSRARDSLLSNAGGRSVSVKGGGRWWWWWWWWW